MERYEKGEMLPTTKVTKGKKKGECVSPRKDTEGHGIEEKRGGVVGLYRDD